MFDFSLRAGETCQNPGYEQIIPRAVHETGFDLFLKNTSCDNLREMIYICCPPKIAVEIPAEKNEAV